MLTKILRNCKNANELFEKAAEGKLQIDFKNTIITNNGFRNQYYENIMDKWIATREEHPILTALYDLSYCAFHPSKSHKVSSYFLRLKKEDDS